MGRRKPDGEQSSAISRALVRGLMTLVRAYQMGVSPWLTPRCRYTPTCSAYALEALDRHGPWRGGWYAVKRLAHCHPWGGFGFDPVPDSGREQKHQHRGCGE